MRVINDKDYKETRRMNISGFIARVIETLGYERNIREGDQVTDGKLIIFDKDFANEIYSIIDEKAPQGLTDIYKPLDPASISHEKKEAILFALEKKDNYKRSKLFFTGDDRLVAVDSIYYKFLKTKYKTMKFYIGNGQAQYGLVGLVEGKLTAVIAPFALDAPIISQLMELKRKFEEIS